MSTPPNNERSPRKWLKQKFRSAFSSKELRSTSTNVPPINSSSDGPRVIADHTGSGKRIGLILNLWLLTHLEVHPSISGAQPSLLTGSLTPANVTTSTSTTSLAFWLTIKDINSPPGHSLNQDSTLKDNLIMAWHGVEWLLQKAEKLTAGTPARTPIAVVNILIELGNVSPFLTLHATFANNIFVGCYRQ